MAGAALNIGTNYYPNGTFPSGVWNGPRDRQYVTPSVAELYRQHGIPLAGDRHGLYIAEFELINLAVIVESGKLEKKGENPAADLVAFTRDQRTQKLDEILMLGRKHAGSVASGTTTRPRRVTFTTPGGRLNEGEDPVRAALREFHEEVFGEGSEKNLPDILGINEAQLVDRLIHVYSGEAYDPRNTSGPHLEPDPANPNGAWMTADIFGVELLPAEMQRLKTEVPDTAVVGDTATHTEIDPETRCVAVMPWDKISSGKLTVAQIVGNDPLMRHLVPLLEGQDAGCTNYPPTLYTISHYDFYRMIAAGIISGQIPSPGMQPAKGTAEHPGPPAPTPPGQPATSTNNEPPHTRKKPI